MPALPLPSEFSFIRPFEMGGAGLGSVKEDVDVGKPFVPCGLWESVGKKEKMIA